MRTTTDGSVATHGIVYDVSKGEWVAAHGHAKGEFAATNIGGIIDTIEAAGTMSDADIAILRNYMDADGDKIDYAKMQEEDVHLFGKALDDASYDTDLGNDIENSPGRVINRAYLEA
jgi:hypothetical protein